MSECLANNIIFYCTQFFSNRVCSGINLRTNQYYLYNFSFGFHQNLVFRLRHRVGPHQLGRIGRDRLHDDDLPLHQPRCLRPQASLSTVRSSEVLGVDAAPLEDHRQAERGRRHSDHPRGFRHHPGFEFRIYSLIAGQKILNVIKLLVFQMKLPLFLPQI
jgi:hypothetical protein